LLADPLPVRSSAAGSVVPNVLMILTATLAIVLVGAIVLQLAGTGLILRTSVLFSRLLAGAIALVVVVALPLWWERNARRRWRATDPLLRRPRVSWVLPWSLVVLLAPILFAPHLARAALSNHGAWMVGGAVPTRVVQRGASAVASVIPVHTPLALTHRTVWPWVDRNSPECTVAPAAPR
jgi:hypothetical protein